jgi:exopolysaccharide production protein ExoY
MGGLSMSMMQTRRAVHARDLATPQPASPPSRVRKANKQRLWASGQWLLAFLMLAFFAPLMLLTALILQLQGGPVLFRHERIGLGGKPFGCLKFRTMAVNAEERLADLLARDEAARAEWERDQKLRHDPRITRFGRLLRKTSVDELPQLLNVLIGEMNLVGPRPIVASEAARYGRRFQSYIAVKPGITGLWQVSGRNNVDYETRVALDSLYAQRRNPGLDLWIMVRTVPAVLLTQGSC